jgi:hypothetical protein
VPVIEVAGDARRGPYKRSTPVNALDREEHGLAAWSHGCRCVECMNGRRLYDRARYAARSLQRSGSARWLVPSAPGARHVEQLRAAGMTVAQIARAAGCCELTVLRLAGADRCWSTVAHAVLGLEPVT